MAKASASALLSVLSGITWTGCSDTIAARHPLSESALAEVNGEVEGRSAIVVVKGDGDAGSESYPAKDLVIQPRTTTVVRGEPTDATRPGSVPTSAIQQITFVRRWRGAAEGFRVGLLAGAATGAALGYALGPNNGPGEGGGNWKPLVALVFALLGCTGAVPGAIVGAAIGHRTSIDFDWTARLHPGETCLKAQIGAIARDAEGTMLRCTEDPTPSWPPVWTGK